MHTYRHAHYTLVKKPHAHTYIYYIIWHFAIKGQFITKIYNKSLLIVIIGPEIELPNY